MSEDLVDLREVKREAARLLPRSDPLRRALRHEPDFLPAEEGKAKLATYARVLLARREG